MRSIIFFILIAPIGAKSANLRSRSTLLTVNPRFHADNGIWSQVTSSKRLEVQKRSIINLELPRFNVKCVETIFLFLSLSLCLSLASRSRINNKRRRLHQSTSLVVNTKLEWCFLQEEKEYNSQFFFYSVISSRDYIVARCDATLSNLLTASLFCWGYRRIRLRKEIRCKYRKRYLRLNDSVNRRVSSFVLSTCLL